MNLYLVTRNLVSENGTVYPVTFHVMAGSKHDALKLADAEKAAIEGFASEPMRDAHLTFRPVVPTC